MSQEDASVTFNIKSSSDAKYVLTLPLSTTVLDLKQKLSTSEYADIPTERQRLIYSGRVLKDADTLETHKVKDGNTIHLVKSAASNQRQNPSNPTSSTNPSEGSAGNVPTNLATGTGNNPLAGLTGARYAGQIQLPGAGMFGPDGGMGAPPSADSMADMLSDPNMQATMNEALQNPQVIEMILQSQPAFRNNPGMRQMIQSPEFRRMMTDPDTIRSMHNMQRSLGMGGLGQAAAFPAPGATNTAGTPAAEGGAATGTTPGQTGANTNIQNPFALLQAMNAQGGGAAAANPFAALFGTPPAGATGAATTPSSTEPGAAAGNTPGSTQPAAPYGLPPMDPAMMQQMMAAFGGGGGGGGAGGLGGANPFGAFGGMPEPAQPADTRPPEERYATQLGQLNDMGFYDFDRNVEALRRTGGSVQGAIEYLLSH